MENSYDIVVIGAGPAGCSFLNSLEKDYSVLLVDRQELPFAKICGGLLTEESCSFLEEKNLEIPDEVYSYPKKLKKKYIDLDNEKEMISGYVYNINRDKFNAWLFDLVKSKADVLERTRLEKIDVEDEEIKVTLRDFDNEEKIISCKYVVGADGVYSKVREELDVSPTSKYIAIQDYGESGNGLDEFLLFFSKDLVDHFVWAIPKREQIIIGLPYPFNSGNKIEADKMETAKKIVEEKINKKIKFNKREGYLVTIPKSSEELHLGKYNIFLIGEAAGWISPSSGDGISFALRSGHNCAQAFNEAENNVLYTYKNNSEKLKEEFEEKIEKYQIITSPEMRASLFK